MPTSRPPGTIYAPVTKWKRINHGEAYSLDGDLHDLNDRFHAALTNPHNDSSGSISAYEYEGYAYPVRDYIYFLLEQKNADYEILSIIVREADTPTVRF